jgi:PAS domain S-box-containing protein
MPRLASLLGGATDMPKPRPLLWSDPSAILRYAIAVLSVAIAIVVADILTRLLHTEPIASSMLCAVIFAAWFGGFGPGLLAIALSLLAFHYYLVPPINSFALKQNLFAVEIAELPRLVLFSITSLFVTFLSSEQRSAKEAALQAEAKAARAEREIRLVTDTIPAIVWSALPDRAVEYFNQRWLTYTGLSLEQARGWGFIDAYHPEDRTSVRHFTSVRIPHGASANDLKTEARLRGVDGKYRWFLERATALRDEAGNIVRWYGTTIDIEDRKRAEDAVRRSEAYLAEAQRLSRTGSFGWRPSSGDIFWSEETFRIFQYDRTTKPTVELILQRVHPDDEAQVKQTIDRASQSGKHFEHEYRLLMPDGSVKHVHVVAHALSDESGSTEFVGAVMDVTQQYQARAALEKALDEIQKSEERLRLILDAIPSTVVSCLPDGSIDFINQRWVEYHGLTLEDLRREGLASLYSPEDRARNVDRRRAAIAAGRPFDYEAQVRRTDGVYRWHLIHYVPLRDGVGNVVKWYGTSIDIEDRKRAEEALRESEQRFRDYAETASDWLWEAGPDHRFIRDSERPDATGLAPPSRIGLARWDYATDVELEPEKWRLHRAMLDAHQPFRDFFYGATRRDGSTMYVQSSGKPFFDAKGDFLGYRGVATDVTAAVRANQAEAALRTVQSELAHVTRVTTLGELTASIAHEVNQPLAAIVSNGGACLRWLARDTPELDEARAAVERMINEGNRAAEVIRRVRVLAKKTDALPAPLPINEVIDEVGLLLQHEVFNHRASLRLELAPELPLVLVDRVQLQQVIINLVMNGMEAMTTVSDRPRELKIRSQREADAVLVAVQDSGVGIDPEHVDRLFNAFFTTKPSGMGMGLSICRSIIEAHGGKLWASRNAGAGATFQFTLPVSPEHAP